MDKLISINDAFEWLRFNGIIKTQKDFATLISVDKSTLNRAMKGDEHYLTPNLLSKVDSCIKFYKEKVDGSVDNKALELTSTDKATRMTSQRQEMKLVPTIPYNVYKETDIDLMEMISNPPQPLHQSPAVAQFPLTDCHYFVNSDAMLPHLHPNDVLALKKIHENAQVINGEICVINSKYNGLIARFVYDDGDYLILKASETQMRFTDMRLHKDDIFGVYRILGLIRTNI